MLHKRWHLFIAPLIATAIGCSSGNNRPEAEAGDSAVTVYVATPFSGGIDNVIVVPGQIEAVQTANISTRVMGYITGVHVKVGDVVRQGQLLFTVSSNDIQAKLAQTEAAIVQAEAVLANAQKDYGRFTVLYKQQSATEKELDNATQQYTAANAAVEAARQMRSEVIAQKLYTSVVSPFSGVVTQKLLDAGNIATPGMPVITIQQSNNLQVSATVPETEIAGIKNGAGVTVNISSAGKSVPGTISQASPSSQFTGGQYVIKVALPPNAQQGLFAGMYVNVSIPAQRNLAKDSSDAIMVPAAALMHKEGLDGLYTLGNNNQAVLRWVRLGKTIGDKVEVLSGLGRNEAFITSASGRLYNGARVKVK